MISHKIKSLIDAQPKGRVTVLDSDKKSSTQGKPKPKSQNNKLILSNIISQCVTLQSMQTQVESKEVIPRYRGKDYPIDLTIAHPGYTFVDTKESQLMVDTMRTFFTDKHYRFRISTALNMSSSGAGAVNSTISCSTLTSNTIFVALSSVFNECFVERFDVHWEPVSEYNFPLTGLPDGKTVSSLAIGVASLQHGQTAYTSLSTLTNNFAFRYHNTGRSFSNSWINVEDSSIPTVATTSAATQAWTAVGNIANYLGSLQFMSQAAPPGLPVSSVLGTFAVHWSVLFRVKV